MNPESTSFTPHTRTTSMTPAPTHGFLGHVVSQNDTQRFSPTTHVDICDANGAWHQIIAFLDSGSDTTLIRSSLAQRLGIAGKSELFRYGVAGGSSKLERSTRYTLQVRPVHVQNVRGYALEAMGIRKRSIMLLSLARWYSTTSSICDLPRDVFHLQERNST